MWQIYIIECRNGALYTGITCDIERRYKEHEKGSARYTRYNPPVKLLYTENCADRSGALKREYQIKSWPRSKKLALISCGNKKCERIPKKISKRKGL